MADTVESLAAHITALEAARDRTLATGASFNLPTGVSSQSHSLTDLETLIRNARTRLARLQAINANLPPFASRVAP
jgi:hypothetical protein